MLWICVSVFFKRTPQFQPLSDIPVRTTRDRMDPSLTSMALLSSDRLVVVDLYNQSVKLVDVGQSMVLHQLVVDGRPWSVCSLPGNKVAVTLLDKHIIHIMDCDNQLSIVNTISVQGECVRLAYSNGHLIVIIDDPSKIEILTMKGGVVKQRDLELSKNFLHKYLSVIAENNVTSIFIYDINNRRILCLDEDLQVLQVYPVLDGASLRCVLAVGQNQLLVTDFNGRLWQLDSTMGRRTLLNQEERFGFAYSMAFCHERNVLYYCVINAVKRYAIS